MAPVAIEILPLQESWEESPAAGRITPDMDWAKLRPADLGWPEHWFEAFLAEQPTSIPACLGLAESAQTVWRQLADIDLVFLDSTDGAVLVELKKQSGSNAKDAVCQLARNLAKAKRILHSRGKTRLRTVACGTWRAGQLSHARNTVAWEYLSGEGTHPAFVTYSCAVSVDGRQFLVLNEGGLPFPMKGKRLIDGAFAELDRLARTLSPKLPRGMGLALYRLDGGVVVRLTADSKLRDKYLGAKLGASHSGPLAAFFRAEAAMSSRGLRVSRVIGHRLELRVELSSADRQRPHQGIESLLGDLVAIANENQPPSPA